MAGKIKLKKINKKIYTYSPALTILTSVILIVIILIKYLSDIASPIIFAYAQLRVEQLGNQIINNAVSKEVLEELDVNKLFITAKNSNGQIVSIDFNPIIVNIVLNEATDVIQKNLKALEKGELHLIDDYKNIFLGYDIERLRKGIIYEMPLGIITNSSLLANLGPRIPIKFSLMGSLVANIETKIKNYGINNIIMEVFIYIRINNRLILPLLSKDINYIITIPVVTKIMPGEIPKFYQSGISQSSSILAIPME